MGAGPGSMDQGQMASVREQLRRREPLVGAVAGGLVVADSHVLPNGIRSGVTY